MTGPVVCLGETMASVTPDPPQPLAHATTLALHDAGAESNVAAGLVALGTPTAFCSRLGDDPLGVRVLAAVTERGVDTTGVRVVPGGRTGVMFKDPQPGGTVVHYYRSGSAASAMDESDAARALSRAPRLLHLTGITPALSASCARAVDVCLVGARDAGVPVSFDVNLRPGLWPDLPTAASVLLRLAARCDLVLVGLDEAQQLWGVTTAQGVRALLPQVAAVVVKDAHRGATCFEDGAVTAVPALPVEVVEPVGAGDAFASGWLHARLAGDDAEAQLRLGHLVAAAVLRSSGDLPLPGNVSRHLHELAVGADRTWPPTGLARAAAPGLVAAAEGGAP